MLIILYVLDWKKICLNLRFLTRSEFINQDNQTLKILREIAKIFLEGVSRQSYNGIVRGLHGDFLMEVVKILKIKNQGNYASSIGFPELGKLQSKSIQRRGTTQIIFSNKSKRDLMGNSSINTFHNTNQVRLSTNFDF